MKFDFSNNFEFEGFVRKIAKECWSCSGYSGPITIDGKERDGVLVNEHQIFCLEVTVAKTAKHTADSCAKLDSLVRRLRSMHPDKGVTGWYITRFEPTGEQGAVLARYRATVNHRTYEAFYASIVDAKEYLIERPKKPFGSIRSPDNDRFDAELKYTATKILNVSTGDFSHTGSIARDMTRAPYRALVVGEYGAGKSMALRDIFQRLSAQYRSGNDSQFPVYVNLRDHVEQFDPDECLRRHASSVGMSSPEKLIKAWRSGLVYLLLDGFDELAPRIATSSRKRAQDLRNSAISLVRRLVDETPQEGSIVLAGRNNYFDTNQELHAAVGVRPGWKVLEINDLDSDDLERFIKDHGWDSGVPDWVPKKPLLISYVKQNGLIESSSPDAAMDVSDPASGWNYLVDKICEREVNQVYVALEPSELRSIFGRLATIARRRSDPRGPLTFADCRRAFVEVTGVEPEERSVTAILRLPGLSGSLTGVQATDLERGSRFFVDPDLADALSGGDVENAIRLPYEYQASTHAGVVHPLGELGRSLAYERLGGDERRSLSDALRIFSSQHSDGARNLCADLINVAVANSVNIPFEIALSNVYMRELKLDGDVDLSRICFNSCAFELLDIQTTDLDTLPSFTDCQITALRCPPSMLAMIDERIQPTNQIDDITYVDVSYATLKSEGAPEAYMDLVSIIDKVFIQSTTGRKLAAVYRGRPSDRRLKLAAIVRGMSRESWIHEIRRGGVDIIVPNMSKAAEAKAIIAKKDFHHAFTTFN